MLMLLRVAVFCPRYGGIALDYRRPYRRANWLSLLTVGVLALRRVTSTGSFVGVVTTPVPGLTAFGAHLAIDTVGRTGFPESATVPACVCIAHAIHLLMCSHGHSSVDHDVLLQTW